MTPTAASGRAGGTARRSPRAPSGAGDSAGFLLWQATLRWQRAITAALRPHGLTHVQFVLLAGTWWLGQHPGPPTQRRLADHAEVDAMMTSQVLRTLEAKGLIARIDDAEDTRAKRVSLTDAGRARVTAALPTVESVDRRFFDAVPSKTLMPVLRALADAPGNEEKRHS